MDFDLARLYEVETRVLKQAVKRNIERFEGDDFMFELTDDEYDRLKEFLRSQIVTLEIDGRGKYPKYPPFAFTEKASRQLIYAIGELSVKPAQPPRRPIGYKTGNR